MTSALKGIQPSFGIVVSNDLGVCWTPTPADADPHVRIRLNVADPTRMTSLLGDDPADVTGNLHPHHISASHGAASALRFHQNMTR